MFQKSHIEKLLRLNGVKPPVQNEEIKAVLISAKWHKDDIDAAILVMQEDSLTHKTHVDSIHKVFRSDERLRPETVSSLLGIQMDMTSADIAVGRLGSKNTMSMSQMTVIALSSLILSLIFVLAAMWHLQMGLFHQALL